MFEKSILFAIALFFSLSGITSVKALEFKKEADKAEWIKNFFKDKEFEKPEYLKKITEQEKMFDQQLLKDFITQNGIEHVEPIAVGKSINDPEIAKFNVACPDKKSIDVYKNWVTYPEATDDILDDPKCSEFVMRYRCTGNLKAYKANVLNKKDGKEDYVLYCDYLKRELSQKKKQTEETGLLRVLDAYLSFDPEKCLYSKKLYEEDTSRKDYLTGIFKYQGEYCFYSIETLDDNNDKTSYGKTSIHIEKRSNGSVSCFYYLLTLRKIDKISIKVVKVSKIKSASCQLILSI